MVTATDGFEERPSSGAGGLLRDPESDLRVGTCCSISDQIRLLWPLADNHIQRIECIAVLRMLVYHPDVFRGRDVRWFVDNTAVLGALVRGRSGDPVVHIMTELIHLLLFCLQCMVYFEWVESDANWSDGMSRLMTQCPWASATKVASKQRQ